MRVGFEELQSAIIRLADTTVTVPRLLQNEYWASESVCGFHSSWVNIGLRDGNDYLRGVLTENRQNNRAGSKRQRFWGRDVSVSAAFAVMGIDAQE